MSESTSYVLDQVDKNIINSLQKGFPITNRPFKDAAKDLEISEELLLERLDNLLQRNILTRFGPMYDAVEFGGGLTLAAMTVPQESFDTVSDYLNTIKQVAHNYEREHTLNMWFVLATEQEKDIGVILDEIETATSIKVYNMPKEYSFFVNLYLPV